MLQDAQELFSKGGINLALFIFFFLLPTNLVQGFWLSHKNWRKAPPLSRASDLALPCMTCTN